MTYSKTNYLVITASYLLPILTFVGSLALLYLAFFSPLFQIKQLECQQDYEPCINPFILAEIDHLKGQNIFLFNSVNFVRKITAGDFQTRDAQIKKKLPDTLRLSLQSVYPILAVQVTGENRLATIDSNLRVIKLTESSSHVPLVVLDTPFSFQIGRAIADDRLTKILEYSSSIVHSIPNITQVNVEGDNLTIQLDSRIVAVFTLHKSSSEQISALKAVLGDATIREGLRKVDVRFAQPVLVKD